MIAPLLLMYRFRLRQLLCCAFLAASLVSSAVVAQEAPLRPLHRKKAPPIITDPRGELELTLCSQNLHDYGTFEEARERQFQLTQEQFAAQRAALVDRFAKTECDVIAVQELLGKTKIEAEDTLRQLVALLKAKTNRVYDIAVAETNDPLSRVAFIVARDRAEILAQLSYDKIQLPKISPHEKPRLFLRAPFELQLAVKGRNGSATKKLNLVTIHFKSKAGKSYDPTNLEWETYRMQMAEAVRRVVESRFTASFSSGETLLAVLGDRNSNYDSASARILQGSVLLKDFQDDPVCRLSKRGVPVCKKEIFRPQRLFSVITGDPDLVKQQGTFQFKGTFSWLDDILMPQESLRTAWSQFDREGRYASGVVRTPDTASDHAMVYVRLNW